jgi:hypothetical protein
MFDALGFKGIWTRKEVRDEPEKVIAKLKELQSHAHRTRDLIRKELPDIEREAGLRIEVETIFLSDTVVIGAWADLVSGASVTTEQRDLGAIVAVSRLTSSVLAHGALKPAPLAYRGCITFGDFALEERFIVGPAVDAAAEAIDAADAALVWLAPSAQHVVHEAIRVTQVDVADLLITHQVPLKGGGSYRTWVVSPFDSLDSPTDREPFVRSVLDTFTGERIDVKVKQQNTAGFLIGQMKRLERAERPATAPAAPRRKKP